MIHPTAVIDPGARLAADVDVGPYAVVGADVELGPGCRIHPHATLLGPTRAGARNVFHPGTVIGGDPQDLSYKGERVGLEIGDDNVFRECVTLNRGTVKAGGVTRIGHRNLLMAYCHVAHDCVLEDDLVLANSVQMGGHVRIEQGAGIGGHVSIQHFVTIGRWSFVGGHSGLRQDVPPYTIVEGYPGAIRGLNLVGLKRRGLSPEQVDALKKAYKAVFRSGEARAEQVRMLLKKDGHTPETLYFLQALQATMASRTGRAIEALRTW